MPRVGNGNNFTKSTRRIEQVEVSNALLFLLSFFYLRFVGPKKSKILREEFPVWSCVVTTPRNNGNTTDPVRTIHYFDLVAGAHSMLAHQKRGIMHPWRMLTKLRDTTHGSEGKLSHDRSDQVVCLSVSRLRRTSSSARIVFDRTNKEPA